MVPTAGLSETIFESGRVAAWSLGMCEEDARDCACSFYLAVALRRRRIEQVLRAKDSHAFLARCARNFAIDYIRLTGRRREREIPLAAIGENGARDQREAGIGAGCPIGEDLWDAIEPALRQSTPRAAYLFRQHYGEGRTARDLAGETGMSVGSVEQSLHRTLVRVKKSVAALFVRA